MGDSLWISRTPTLVLIALFVFLVTLAVANKQGIKAARQAWKSTTHVRLVFKAGENRGFDPELVEANKRNDLSILTQTKDLVIVFEPQGKGVLRKSVFVLARADVLSVHTSSEGKN